MPPSHTFSCSSLFLYSSHFFIFYPSRFLFLIPSFSCNLLRTGEGRPVSELRKKSVWFGWAIRKQNKPAAIAKKRADLSLLLKEQERRSPYVVQLFQRSPEKQKRNKKFFIQTLREGYSRGEFITSPGFYNPWGLLRIRAPHLLYMRARTREHTLPILLFEV